MVVQAQMEVILEFKQKVEGRLIQQEQSNIVVEMVTVEILPI